MFGIKELEKRVRALELENKKLHWLINNPCPYKVGQKTSTGRIITKIRLNSFFLNQFSWDYEAVTPLKK